MSGVVEIEVWQNNAAHDGRKAVWCATVTINGTHETQVVADTRDDALASAKRKAREILMRETTHERHVIPIEELLS
jgi:hypothetical protein